MAAILFRNARIFDGSAEQYRRGDVLVEGAFIQTISEKPLQGAFDEVVDVGGRVLMPGLIDNHVHVYWWNIDAAVALTRPPTYLAQFAAKTLRRALDWGFTSVRDTAGADVGLASAIDDGYFPAPRLFYGGKALSQTGGHADFRRRGEALPHVCSCVPHGCADSIFARIVDGADAVRRAVRDELRQGAHHIKLMASGGVMSPTDPLENDQFSDEEIRVAVEECARHGVYVTAHCHPTHSVRRCVDLGVRCIEHGTLIDRETSQFVASKGAYVVPTMSVIFALSEEGSSLGLSKANLEKLALVSNCALDSLKIMRAAGVKLGFGTDLLGKHQVRQCEEFSLRAKVETPLDILRSVTSVNAEILMQQGRLGCISAGAFADILVVDGEPMEDISVLGRNGAMLPVIMKGGVFHKREI